jgi:hypothetical protein
MASETSIRRRAILLIPGLKREERFHRRDVLARNLELIEATPLRLADEIELGGERGRRLVARPLRRADAAPAPDLDVFEAYWADMLGAADAPGPWSQLARGFELVLYWVLHPGMWRALGTSRAITIGLMAGGTLLVLWYVGILLVVAQAIARDPGQLPDWVREVPLLSELLALLLEVAQRIGTWQVWALAALLLAFARIDDLVLMARFIKDYLQNLPDERELGLRDRLRQRVTRSLEAVLSGPYDEVVIVAHSFGTVIAVELLADWPHQADMQRLRLVTWGSPIGVLRHRSPWLDDQLRRLLARADRPVWLDCHAPSDWLCTAVPGQAETYGSAGSEAYAFNAGPGAIMSMRTHLFYYRHQPALERLAAA